MAEREKLIALGHAIRRLRQAQHLSIAALARVSGVSAKHLNKIELGQRNSTFEKLDALAGALGVTLGQLVCAAETKTEGEPHDAPTG